MRSLEGADGLVKNPRNKFSIVFKGQDEIMRPNTEGARRGVNKSVPWKSDMGSEMREREREREKSVWKWA